MSDRTHEQTINTALGEVLQRFGRTWRVRAERIGPVFVEGGRPDVLVEKPGDWPVVIEAEVGNHHQAELEAADRLGKRLVGNPRTVDFAVPLVYPSVLRERHGAELRQALNEVTFEYAVLYREADDRPQRLPTSGWLSGDLRDLAMLLHLLSVPSSRVDELADALATGVTQAERSFSATHPVGSSLGTAVAAVLRQNDDEEGQTRKMAMTVIANALVFHEALAEAEFLIEDPVSGKLAITKPPRAFRSGGSFLPTPLLDHWEAILKINYWPIFHTAGAILRVLPSQTAVNTLNILWETAEVLIAGGVTKSHDLTGVVFQRLIADRKFLATYYTRPAAATLLSALALPVHLQMTGRAWGDTSSLSSLRIGDLACGTGTLLSTAYQRVSLLHELHGGDPAQLHPLMMRQGLVGLDVLNIAVHLTAAMLAGSHPATPFDGECLLTVPYGRTEWGAAVGSLSLLEPQESFDFMRAAAAAGGKGEEIVRDLLARVGHEQFDLVIMNPPFTRHGAREGDRSDVHNPAFAAFEADEREQDLLSRELRRLETGGSAHGHAGMASYFVELAHRKAAETGTVALVLPLSAMSGGSWEGVRSLWRQSYRDIRVVSIAAKGSHTRSFSADTGMAECLLVARKQNPEGSENRAAFAVLGRQPETPLDGELMGDAINSVLAKGGVRRLEDGPVGGSLISLGDTTVGEVIDCPLPSSGPWSLVGIRSIDLGQTAYQLARGRLWIEGMSLREVPTLPIARIKAICARIGPHDLDITGGQIKTDGLPQGPFEKLPGVPDGASYPFLWNHDSKRERQLYVEPDSHGRIRDVGGQVPDRLRERAAERWSSAARAHYSRDLRFNSQSLIVAMTKRPSLGGRAWPTVVLHDSEQEFAFALWSNSTLGLLCHWWSSNKTQDGRGSTTITSIPLIPTLNVCMLSRQQHDAARAAFSSFNGRRFLPFDQIDEDDARAELDRRLLVDVLGLESDLCQPDGPLNRLRRKLAGEPQIHGGKRTRVEFTADGERAVPRVDRN